jgi:hypothetical protein
LPNELQLILGAAKAASETSVGRAALTAAAKLIEETAPVGMKAAVTEGATKFEKIVKDSWVNAPFRQLTESVAKDWQAASTEKMVATGSWSRLRLAEGEKSKGYVDLPPAISAIIKSDQEILRPASPFGKDWDKNTVFNDSSTKFLARSIGLNEGSLRYEAKSGLVQMRLSENVATSPTFDPDKFVLPTRNQFGVREGYITDRKALGAIWQRYVPTPCSLTIDAYPEKVYTDREMRLIEKHLGLPESSFHYQGSELIFSPPAGFKREALKAAEEMSPALGPQFALPYEAEIARVPGGQHLNFAIDGAKFPLEPRSDSVTDWRYPVNWKGAAKYSDSDFKLRVIAGSGTELGRVHDVFIPRLHNDPEFKELLTNWKVVNPMFRTKAGALTGQDSKALTLYPLSTKEIPRLYAKLDGIIGDEAPDLILPAPPETQTVDRLLGNTNRVAMAREHFPANSSGVVPLDQLIAQRFAHDKDLPRFSAKSRIAALEELTGIRPGELKQLDDGRLAIQAKPHAPGVAYVHEGHSLSRSIHEIGYTDRWAMHLAGGRYNVDPLNFHL